MEIREVVDRRAPDSKALRAGALRCEQCGTTWFDVMASQIAGLRRKCRRCGGRLHAERRARPPKPAAGRAV